MSAQRMTNADAGEPRRLILEEKLGVGILWHQFKGRLYTREEIEREWEHGRLVWKIELYANGVEYDVRVDARTGAIVRFRADDDRRGRGRGGDD